MTFPHPSNATHGPPGLGTSGIVTCPRRRQTPSQPPNLLTTSLGNARAGLAIGGFAQTPVSTTSLSSPFSAYPQSPHPQSPGSAMRETSPMSFRSASGFNTTYNPQQWGPVSSSSTNSVPTLGERRQTSQSSRLSHQAPRPGGPDEPLVSPPPPYSPRRDHQQSQDSPRRPGGTISPTDTTSPGTESSRYGTPVSTATTLSPDPGARYPQGRFPLGRQQTSPNESPNSAATLSFPPPPSTKQIGQPLRSASKNHADRLLSSLTSRGKPANTVSYSNAMHVSQQHNAQSFTYGLETSPDGITVRAPAARRAASTGGIGLAGGQSRPESRSPSPATWEPTMPLPPPPAGPPPASTRSQSLNRPMESPSSGFAPALPLRSRRPPGNGTALDTVPPTPADWREEDGVQYRATSRDGAQGPARLHIDTGSIVRKRQSGTDLRITTTAATSARDSSAGGLFRSPAVRTRSAKGIRERRSESRNGKGRSWIDSAIEHSNSGAPWAENVEEKRPTDLVLSPSQVNASKQKIISRPTPKSGKSMQSLDSALNSAEMQLQAGKAVSFQSSHSTPQGSSRSQQVPDASMLTPPFSPGNYVPSALESLAPVEASPPLPPKLHEFDSPSKSHEPSEALSVIIPPAHEQRPVSHILHLPNSNDSIQIPLTPLTKAAQESIADLLGPESPKAFATRAMERHRVFAEREAAAASDSERLDLFIHYMAAESRIRREQYSSVFNEEHIDVDELTRGFFGHTETNHKSHERQQIARCEDASKRTSIASSALEDSSSQGDSSAVSRKYESPSSVTTNSSTQHRPESTWWKDYVPCLSPIASMSIVTGQDEMDSRGRAPSRWWEGSHSGDAAQGDAFKVLERSKRESKYMGVPCESRTSPAIYDTGASASQSQTLGSSRQAWYGLKEYPPEKIGWHKTNSSAPPPPPKPPTPLSAQVTPDPRSLDISRLVTLPPPYPRHHPAVNNSHPNLADVRAVVRLLQEKGAEAARDSYRTQILDERKRADSWCKHQRSLHGQDIKFRIERGELSQDQFEDAELELADKLVESEKAVVQADFDLFQNVVLTPLHGLLSDRISLATNSLDKLSSRLFSDAQSRSPNLPQEEGDEQPELLEKLTQLKWLFEARENLHRQIYDLLSERNHRYKEIVLLPYKHSHNRDKHAEAELFFTQDAQERRSAFEQAAYSRAQAFLSVIENNVSRGAEVQLSAFWDIAPSLLELLHKIPDRLEGFSIHIPADEYAENPAYYDHPLQYLYSLLGHTEKSTYQFIESQINLFCLLHEIRSCALVARCRVEELEGDGAERQRAEERKLTDDLKEKVGMVEGQWQEALGAELREVRERVRGALLEAGGWDDEGDDV